MPEAVRVQFDALMLQPLFDSLEPAFGRYGGVIAQDLMQEFALLLRAHE